METLEFILKNGGTGLGFSLISLYFITKYFLQKEKTWEQERQKLIESKERKEELFLSERKEHAAELAKELRENRWQQVEFVRLIEKIIKKYPELEEHKDKILRGKED